MDDFDTDDMPLLFPPPPEDDTEPEENQIRKRLHWKSELTLALLPTLTVLLMLWFIETYGHQRLLFASLASSAFLIYVDPQLRMNRVRTLIIAQLAASIIGYLSLYLLGAGYVAAAVAMAVFTFIMVFGDFVHPPAVSTVLTFAFRPNTENALLLFAMAVGIIVLLVGLATVSTWLVHRLSTTEPPKPIT